jgi:hypothetical protein
MLETVEYTELRKMEAIKNYADKDDIRTHAGKAHGIRQSNALTTQPHLDFV